MEDNSNTNTAHLVEAKQLGDNAIELIKMLGDNVKIISETNKQLAESLQSQFDERCIKTRKEFEISITGIFTKLLADINVVDTSCSETVLKAFVELDDVFNQEIKNIHALYTTFEEQSDKFNFIKTDEIQLVKFNINKAVEHCIKALKMFNEVVSSANSQRYIKTVHAHDTAKSSYLRKVEEYFNKEIDFVRKDMYAFERNLVVASSNLFECLAR